MFGRLANRIVKPSTIAFVREGLRSRAVSWPEILHGYIYGRWIYHYIGTGLGGNRLARVGGPIVGAVQRILPKRPRPQAESGTFADSYHGKVVPLDTAKQLVSINRAIEITNLEHVVPFAKARDIILHDPDHIAVLDCPCRAARENPCLPLDVCLIVGEPFVSFVLDHHPQRARAISGQQAIDILEAEHERGHVHHAFFKDAMLGRFYAICNCCACCCGAMQSTRNGIPMIIPSGYISQVDADLCVGCGACKEYCQFGAMHIGFGYTIVVDESVCMGCGVCVDQCDMGALTLVAEPSRGVPLDLGALMAETLAITA